MNLFIDTNIYLTFYHYTNDDLVQLEKLLAAIESKKIYLYIPEQVKNEFKRNREVKIADALTKLEEQKIPKQFPQICKDYPEFATLSTTVKKFEEEKSHLISKLFVDIKNKSLGADKIIGNLFNKAKTINTTGEIFQKAKYRYDIGNPPGKKASYGDAINWECLLKTVPSGEELHLIARDKDYISIINENSLAEFLIDEWYEKKNSDIFFYKNLSEFFTQHFPNIKIASEIAKEAAISDFVNSFSFASTHYAISKLSQFTDLTQEEINLIINAAITNGQIFAIAEDTDVNEYLKGIIKGKEEIIPQEKLIRFNELYNSSPEDKFDSKIPF